MSENKRFELWKTLDVMIKNLLGKKCSNCGAELPKYSNYESDLLDSRGYSEVWICPKCRKHHKRGDLNE